MNKVIIDKDMLARLKELREQLEFCDEHGETLGVFQPTPSRERSLVQDVEIPVTDEEMQQIERELAEGKFFSTDEVLAHLKGLERQ